MLDQRTVSEAAYTWERDEAVATPAYRECAYALLRLTLGIVFLFSGVGKFLGGIGNFETQLVQQFAGKLPAFLVSPFAYALPFVEVAVGAMLVIGLFNGFALVLSGLLLAALTFGTVMAGEQATAAHNVAYGLVNFVLLWFAGYNRYSLDSLIRRRPIER